VISAEITWIYWRSRIELPKPFSRVARCLFLQGIIFAPMLLCIPIYLNSQNPETKCYFSSNVHRNLLNVVFLLFIDIAFLFCSPNFLFLFRGFWRFQHHQKYKLRLSRILLWLPWWEIIEAAMRDQVLKAITTIYNWTSRQEILCAPSRVIGYWYIIT
jgi:hypothetical protein